MINISPICRMCFYFGCVLVVYPAYGLRGGLSVTYAFILDVYLLYMRRMDYVWVGCLLCQPVDRGSRVFPIRRMRELRGD